ncbi:hypothetical protein CIRG_06528 [Coccidioides immitis RMSCC 2394]|uniref:Tc1-like transposase DDE domain-containing protein n=2 Tax=Coccidioides TaxID=5500 RepID=A0A0J7B9Y7_COCIT|nr:hypothetical protein CPAG_05021 [Coccidioides posadasii RMSCC 3488]KMP06847.1 hypothetical protein CIRG_06528 [Coccidioides immitis RMSCC 2394]
MHDSLPSVVGIEPQNINSIDLHALPLPISRICLDNLPPYSPDLNPIEEFFAEMKAFIRRNWQVYEEDPAQGFDSFLEWCVDIVGKREESAKGHFRRAGLTIDEI